MAREYRFGTEQANTKLYYLLHGVSERQLHYDEHENLRHPLGIYNVSMKNIKDAVKDFYEKYYTFVNKEDTLQRNMALNEERRILLEQRETGMDVDSRIEEIEVELKHMSDVDTKKGSDMVKAYMIFLNSIIGYIDDTFNILKTFYPADIVKKPAPVFAYQWVKKVDRALYNRYDEKLSDYRETIAPIVNRIKHQHGRLDLIVFNDDVYGMVPGYFVEGYKHGVIGPDRQFHKPFSGMETAFSFHRDLKYHLFNVYHISEVLAAIIKVSLEKKMGSVLEYDYDGTNDEIEIWRIADKMPSIYFPDEYMKPIPDIRILDNEVRISFGCMSMMNPMRHGMIRGSLNSDGVSTSYQLPYYKQG